MDNWKFFKEIDFTDKSVTIFHLDTRDFYCATQTEKDISGLNIEKISKYPLRFFWSADQVINILTTLFNESGGKAEWRMLTLKGDGKEYSANWQLKYLRIHRTELGLVICDSHHKAISKQILEYPVDEENCYTH